MATITTSLALEATTTTATSAKTTFVTTETTIVNTTTHTLSYGDLRLYDQCGGQSWSGKGSCSIGLHCVSKTEWYSQCLPGGGPPILKRPANGPVKIFCFSLVAPGTYEVS